MVLNQGNELERELGRLGNRTCWKENLLANSNTLLPVRKGSLGMHICMSSELSDQFFQNRFLNAV